MASYHTRSNSLPSRQHPLISEFDEQLSRLRSSQEASSSTSIASKLNGLQDLHECVDQLLLLTLHQKPLSNEQNEKLVSNLLDGSLIILDVCNTAKDALLQIKESVQELQSILRRKRSGETDQISCLVKKFFAARKVMKNLLYKAIKNKSNLKSGKKCQETVEIISMLREVESVTLSVFESLSSFISGPKLQKSLLSKMMNSKRVVCEGVNEFESVEAALNLLVSPKVKKSDNQVEENAQNGLQKLDMCVQDLEEGVESLYRRLIKTRVSLLNIINH